MSSRDEFILYCVNMKNMFFIQGCCYFYFSEKFYLKEYLFLNVLGIITSIIE